MLSLVIWALLRDMRLAREGIFPLRCLRSAGLQAGRQGPEVLLGVSMVGGPPLRVLEKPLQGLRKLC